MLLATLSPHVSFRQMLVSHPSVGALRFNTITPQGNRSKNQLLVELLELCGDKPLWLDLKARQLRITSWADPSTNVVEISHKIKVDLPTTLFFKDHQAVIVEIVDGNKLILEEEPRRPVGAGEPVNILDPSLVIEGFLTEDDQEYIEVAKSLGINRFMLSFVEKMADVAEVLTMNPGAEIIAKIESRKGLVFATTEATCLSTVRLMAARDDLYINMGQNKIDMLSAEQSIISVDPDAIAASRILTSLEGSDQVSLSDLSDLHLLHLMGYKHFMLSDWLCRDRRAFTKAAEVYTRYSNRFGE